jgi:hypothetical protein
MSRKLQLLLFCNRTLAYYQNFLTYVTFQAICFSQVWKKIAIKVDFVIVT